FVFNDISVGGDSTIWTIGDSTIVDEDILNFFYEDPGLYALQQQVYNEFGCQDTVSFRFEIIDELAIYVPTAFTPNGDQLNDVWKPVMAGESRIDQYHLMVMGRSGQIMFDTHDYTKGWDAQNTKRTDKLEDVQNSVFTYQLRVLPSATPLHPDPDWLEYTGHVTIID
ncbi:MAG: gliding motility-associated C-terminal domain-containing protein, partial [Bacteroidota bacterium]|nr:gliding motility-associated C-terminal domain-containing protein [Bacteroidota bacterium]